MEINLLRVHRIVREALLNSMGQGVLRIDENGYEYIDDRYLNMYDAYFSICVNTLLVW